MLLKWKQLINPKSLILNDFNVVTLWNIEPSIYKVNFLHQKKLLFKLDRKSVV